MLTSIGDLAQSQLLRRQVTSVKTDLDRLAQEVATGRTADAAARLQGDVSTLGALVTDQARLAGFATVTTEMNILADTQQRALGRIDQVAGTASAALLAATYGADQALATAGTQSRNALEVALSSLNLRHADRSLFAGIATDGPAMAEPDVVMAAASRAVAGAGDAAAVLAALDRWFANPAGFGALYLGDRPAAAVALAPGEEAALDITAEAPAITATLKGLVLGALLAGNALPAAPGPRAELARRAGEMLLTGASARADLMGHLGQTQEQIAQAQARNSAEAAGLDIARNELLAVDPYEAATRLQDVQTRLETLFALTARLQRLSLAEYL